MSNSFAGPNGPTPARRSTRLASMPRSNVSVDQSIAGASITPGRASARRKGALPKVKASHSTAYGSSGRVGAAQDMQVNHSGFAQGFDDLRDKALTRDEERKLAEDLDHHSNSNRASVEPSEQGSFTTGLRRHAPSQDPSISNEQSGQDVLHVAHSTKRSVVTSSRVTTRPPQSSFAESSRQSARGYRQSYIEEDEDDIDNNSSPTPSNIDTSKSFGQVHEGGMPSVRIGANGTTRPVNAYQVDRELPRTSGFRREAELARPVNGLRGADNARAVRGSDAVHNIPQSAARGRVNRVGRDENPNGDRVGGENNVENNSFWKFNIAKIIYGILGLLVLALLSRQLQGHSSSATTPSTPGLMDAINSRIAYNWNGVVHWIAPPTSTSAPTPTPNPIQVPSADGSYEVELDGPPIVENPTSPNYDTNFDRIGKLERQAKGIIMHMERFLPPTVVVLRNEKGDLEVPDEFWRALVARIQTGGPAWDEYMEKNRIAAQDIISKDIERQKLVDRQEFATMVKERYLALSELVEKKVESAVATLNEEIMVALDRQIMSAKDVVAQRAAKGVLDDIRTQYLALAHLNDIIRINTQKVNYFSLGNGARINQYETSSTYTKSSSVLSRLSQSVLSSIRRLPPVAALQGWEEPGDCWCAAPDNGNLGLAQLSVSLGQRVYPTQVTIEHLPKLASVDISTAPREIELWAPATEVRLEAPGCHAGPAGYACLGRFSYDVHGSTSVQTFSLDGEAVPTGIDKALVRVTSNYAGDFTCLYRVRLHGEMVSGSE